mgnify:CR=1 FL=1
MDEIHRFQIDRLIASVLQINVKELEILVGDYIIVKTTVVSQYLISTPRMFPCQALVSLKTNRNLDLIIPELVSLPSVKVMHLEGFGFVD